LFVNELLHSTTGARRLGPKGLFRQQIVLIDERLKFYDVITNDVVDSVEKSRYFFWGHSLTLRAHTIH